MPYHRRYEGEDPFPQHHDDQDPPKCPVSEGEESSALTIGVLHFSWVQIVAIIAIVGAVVGAVVGLSVLGGDGEISGAPQVSAGGVVGQNPVFLGREGAVAEYSVYRGGEKVGKYVYTREEGRRVDISGSVTLQGMKLNADGYFDFNPDLLPSEYHIKMEGGGVSINMTSSMDYDKMTVTTDVSVETPTSATSRTVNIEVKTEEALKGIPPEKLKVGYSRTFDVEVNERPETFTQEVLRKEEVTVPKGTFSCYVLRVSGPNSEITRWITGEGGLVQYSWTIAGYSFTAKLKSYHK